VRSISGSVFTITEKSEADQTRRDKIYIKIIYVWVDGETHTSTVFRSQVRTVIVVPCHRNGTDEHCNATDSRSGKKNVVCAVRAKGGETPRHVCGTPGESLRDKSE
jgi:hypothetical protein